MAKILPITLVGDNLGKRHMYLNSLVSETYKERDELDSIINLPEKSAIDRLFKIELAIKTRNVDYILQNLRDDDMLYVSRALKAKWLFEPEYKEMINPEYLEEQLYPDMITTAVTKMKHWIHLNLNDTNRSKQFYDYYRKKNFQLASKFLVKCTKDHIRNEFKDIILKVTPSYLKLLSEKCPEVSKTFFDSISEVNEVKSLYLSKERDYYTILINLLKTNSDMVLDFAEKYFNTHNFSRFSATQTKFIMKHHRNRFCKKPELYTRWLLNTEALAETLNAEEAKELVIKMVQASYLKKENWCSYQTLEPFVKRIKPDERAAFKKLVFVEKNIGETAEEWPYKLPAPPTNEQECEAVFTDRQPDPSEYSNLSRPRRIRNKILRKKRGPKYPDIESVEVVDNNLGPVKVKTLLEELFDEFRFASFGRTLYELRKRIPAESSSKNRKFMMYVLISKTGGHLDAVASLLELLKNHVKEPDYIRAAVIRSLVKHAQVWRLPEASWNHLMQFGHGLGFDGKQQTNVECSEGMHCVVIRNLLQNGNCNPDVLIPFLDRFSNFREYSLNQSEEKIISTLLPKILLDLVNKKGEKTFSVANCLLNVFQALMGYGINLETFPYFVDTVVKYGDTENYEMNHIIGRLFEARVARKQLFPFTAHKISDESCLNTLKHDITKLDPKQFVEHFSMCHFKSDRFFRKLTLYFRELNGLANQYLKEFRTLKSKLSRKHGRVLAYLLSDQFIEYVNQLDDRRENKFKSLAGAIRANAHLTRPPVNIDEYGWKKCGSKHIGNKLSICRGKDVDKCVEELLKWKSTARNAFNLSKRTSYQNYVFVKLASIRPTVAIKIGLKLIMKEGDDVDPLIWRTIKPIILELDITKHDRRFIATNLGYIKHIPPKIKPDYSTLMYNKCLKINRYHAMPALCHAEIILSDVDEQFTIKVISDFLENDFTLENLSNENSEIKCSGLYVRIMVKYILLCNTENDLKYKIKQYLEPFLTVLEQLRESDEKKDLFQIFLSDLLCTLKYRKVFLDTIYTSPLPLFERIIVWMRKYFQVEKHFKSYAQIHLLMLFYKSTQQAITLDPNMFTDKKKKDIDIIKAVGSIFGKFIASEVKQLQTQFFESVPEMYVLGIVSFLKMFNFDSHGAASTEFLISIIISFLEVNDESVRRLGIYLMENKRYSLHDDEYTYLINYVRGLHDTQSQWFVSFLE